MDGEGAVILQVAVAIKEIQEDLLLLVRLEHGVQIAVFVDVVPGVSMQFLVVLPVLAELQLQALVLLILRLIDQCEGILRPSANELRGGKSLRYLVRHVEEADGVELPDELLLVLVILMAAHALQLNLFRIQRIVRISLRQLILEH